MEPETRRRLETEASWMEQFAESGYGARLSTAIARERAADIRAALADSDLSRVVCAIISGGVAHLYEDLEEGREKAASNDWHFASLVKGVEIHRRVVGIGGDDGR